MRQMSQKDETEEQLFSVWYVSNDVPKSEYIDDCKCIEDEKTNIQSTGNVSTLS